MTQYIVHVYKLAQKLEIPVESDTDQEAMEIALAIAKSPERSKDFVNSECPFIALPFIVNEKPKQTEEEDVADYELPGHTD